MVDQFNWTIYKKLNLPFALLCKLSLKIWQILLQLPECMCFIGIYEFLLLTTVGLPALNNSQIGIVSTGLI